MRSGLSPGPVAAAGPRRLRAWPWPASDSWDSEPEILPSMAPSVHWPKRGAMVTLMSFEASLTAAMPACCFCCACGSLTPVPPPSLMVVTAAAATWFRKSRETVFSWNFWYDASSRTTSLAASAISASLTVIDLLLADLRDQRVVHQLAQRHAGVEVLAEGRGDRARGLVDVADADLGLADHGRRARVRPRRAATGQQHRRHCRTDRPKPSRCAHRISSYLPYRFTPVPRSVRRSRRRSTGCTTAAAPGRGAADRRPAGWQVSAPGSYAVAA